MREAPGSAGSLHSTLEGTMYTNSVIPLYAYDGDTKKYHSVGSAVLVSHRSRRFFITAAHVIEQLQGKKTFVFFDDGFYDIGGLPAFLSDCSTFDSRNDDPLDLAAIPLEEFIRACPLCGVFRVTVVLSVQGSP